MFLTAMNPFYSGTLFGLIAILLVALIVLVVKLIGTANRANRILDEIEEKVSKLNGFFNFIDRTSSMISIASNRIGNTIAGFANIFGRRKNKKNEEDDYE